MGQVEQFPMHKSQEDKPSMQDEEIKERLSHIKNKISSGADEGRLGPGCGAYDAAHYP